MYLAIDIGGTKTALGFYKSLKPSALEHEITYPTIGDYATALDKIATELAAQKSSKLQAIGVSVAAMVNPDNTLGIDSNLTHYRGHNLIQDLNERLSVPVFIKNDAVCAAYAEAHYGAAKKVSRLLHLIIGTGLGGAYILKHDGQLIDIPLEPEYMIAEPAGLPHHLYPLKGMLGAYIAGREIALQVNTPLDTLPTTHHIFDRLTTYLALGIYNLSVLLHPELVTLSGSVIQEHPDRLKELQTKLERYQSVITPPTIKITALKNPSLLGALSLIPNKTPSV